MGFGKWLVGGVCAVGAVIAAPVLVPAAGMAVAGSLATGAIGTTVGLGMATASASTVATVAGVTAGAAGVAAAYANEKKTDKARTAGEKQGYERASGEYETKFRKLNEETEEVIRKYQQKEKKTNADIEELKQFAEYLIKRIKELEEAADHEKYAEEMNIAQNQLKRVNELMGA